MELLIAMTVIVIGLFSAMTLVYSNVALVDRDTDEVVAVNLAREGMELAKQVRDSNWLAGLPYDAGMGNGTDYTATLVWDGVIDAPSFDPITDALSQPNAQVVISTSTSPTGFLTNANAEKNIKGTSTIFRRLMTFHPLCDDQSAVESGSTCEATGHTKIGVRVESHVQWNRKGQAKDMTMYSDLYDWR